MSIAARERAHRSDLTSDVYKGIPAHAAAGLHAEIYRNAVEYFSPSDGPILDLAAGSGALTQRLADGGFEPHPVDLSVDGWRVRGIKPVTADFNKSGWINDLEKSQYRQVIAGEVIEHLENPRRFFRDIYSLLEVGGRAIVTTPNPLSAMSVALSFVGSRYYVFDRESYWSIGHVGVIPPWMLGCHAEDAGLKVLKLTTVCKPVFNAAWKTVVHSCFQIVLNLARRQEENSNQISLLVVEKPGAP